MRKLLLLAIAAVVFYAYFNREEIAAKEYITPTYAGDFDAFVKFLWAQDRCYGIKINYDKTMEQIVDLGPALGWDSDMTSQQILVRARAAKAALEKSKSAFCMEARKLFDSYDPAHLYKVGVTFGL